MPQRRPSNRRRSPVQPSGATRAQIVWVSFLAAMTIAGGLMLLVDGRPSPRSDGLSLSPLAAATTIGSDAADPLTQTRVPLDLAKWQAIVIHHSGSTRGDAASIEREERDLHGGYGHHFIIGNGNGMDDGQVHIGYRWLDQLSGAHASGPNAQFYNDHAISICLVGDGNRQGFTPAQLRQLARLVESLRRATGLPVERVLLQSDLAAVSDPGKLFPAGMFNATSLTRR
jgi:N-acetyl-anhydromuramyl-L-alanine amidase AmpD